MDVANRLTGYAAAAVIVGQGMISLVLRPSGGDNYSGTTADIVNDSMWASGLVLLGIFLLGRAWRFEARSTGTAISGAGCLLLASSILMTVGAGEERWGLGFIGGFGLFELGLLISLVSRRTLVLAAMALGMVLALAFFDVAGALALGVATLLLVRESAGHDRQRGSRYVAPVP